MKFKTGVYKLDRPGRECNNDLIFHLRSEVNRSQLIEERKARSVQENEFVNIIVQQFCEIYELWYFLSGKEKKEEAGVFESGNSSRAQPFLFLLFFSMYFHHFEFYLHCLFFFFLAISSVLLMSTVLNFSLQSRSVALLFYCCMDAQFGISF